MYNQLTVAVRMESLYQILVQAVANIGYPMEESLTRGQFAMLVGAGMPVQIVERTILQNKRLKELDKAMLQGGGQDGCCNYDDVGYASGSYNALSHRGRISGNGDSC